MEKKLYFNIISILFFSNIYSIVKSDYVIFDLKTFKNNSDYYDEYEKFFYDNLYNILYSEIALGPNHEKIIMELKVDTTYLSIYNHNCEIPPVDNSKNTSYLPTFADSKILKSLGEFNFEGEYYLSLLENSISLKTNNGEKKININYLYSPRNNSNYTEYINMRPYTCFRLGFDIPYIPPYSTIDSIKDYALNLGIQCKRNNITSSYNWFIEYNSNNNELAKLIIGAAPHDYNPKKYNEENSKKINTLKRMDESFHWDIEVNEIYVKNKTGSYLDNDINLYLYCSLEPSLGVIFGTSGYKIFIEENLFSQLISEKKCRKSNPLILNLYMVYYCKKDTKEYLKENFPTISFLHRYFNKSFELNYDDLFAEKGDYIYFKIFFHKREQEMWKFGKPFLSKYFFSFDLDGRTISFYDKIGIDEKETEKNGNILNNNLVLIIIIIILALLVAVLGFFIGKFIYKTNIRKKGEELQDSDIYNYESVNDN